MDFIPVNLLVTIPFILGIGLTIVGAVVATKKDKLSTMTIASITLVSCTALFLFGFMTPGAVAEDQRIDQIENYYGVSLDRDQMWDLGYPVFSVGDEFEVYGSVVSYKKEGDELQEAKITLASEDGKMKLYSGSNPEQLTELEPLP